MKALVFVLLIFLFVNVSTSSMPVWLSPPALVANGQAVRIDIETITTMHHARVTRVIACSATDKPFRSYKPTLPEASGCNSPGFERQEIYSVDSSTAQLGSLASKFRVRQTAQSLYIRRRLVEKHSPIVYLEVHLHLQDGSSRTVSPLGVDVNEWVLETRFECLERALPVNVDDYDKGKNEHPSTAGGGLSEIISSLGPPREDDSDQLVDIDILDTSHSKSSGMHWGYYVMLFGFFGIAIPCMIYALYMDKMRKYKRKQMRPYQVFGMQTQIPKDHEDDYAKSKQAAETNVIRHYMNAGIGRGVFSSSSSSQQRRNSGSGDEYGGEEYV